MSLTVALAQIVSGADPEGNLALITEQVAAAAAAGADLVVLPEATMRAFGHRLAPVAEPLDGPWATRVADLAATHALTIVVGMFTPADAGRVHNTLLVAHPDRSRQHYDKLHLFDAYGFAESDTVAAGDAAVCITVNDTMIGLSTCYDVRFGQLYLDLADQGAEAIVVAASWGAGEGKPEQWDLLVRARAIDSGSWILACGQADPLAGNTGPGYQHDPGHRQEGVGPTTAPTGVGLSQVISPYGVPVVRAGAAPELVVTTIEPQLAQQARQTMGVLANRR